jgi:hypothetical protein
MDPFRQQAAMMGLKKAGGGFNPYAAGDKQYGITGRRQATQGPVSPEGQRGYNERDTAQKARRQAVLQRMQAAQNGNYMSSNYLWGVK